MIVHPLLEKVFQALEQAKICWCLLRIPCDLMAPTGDVDLLIDPANVRDVQRILYGLGFALLPRHHGPDVFYLSYHRETDDWIWLHVVSEISFGPYHDLQTHGATECLARRQRDGVIVVLAPDDAFWALLLHCLLDKGAIATHNAQRLRELVGAARLDGPLARMLETVCPTEWCPARLIDCVRAEDWATLEHFGPVLAATWMQRHRIGALRALVKHGLSLMSKLLNLPRRRGLSVALLGPDGAGKSTLAAGIQNSFFFPVRSVYMGVWLKSTAPIYRRVPGSILTRRVALLWWRYLRAQYYQIQGQLVIFDRHSCEYLVRLHRPLTRIGRIYYWLQAHALPGPDLVLVLDAPGDLMFQRKGERSVTSLEAERQQLLALRQDIPRLQVVDATRDTDTVRAEVVERIWQQYMTYWRSA